MLKNAKNAKKCFKKPKNAKVSLETIFGLFVVKIVP